MSGLTCRCQVVDVAIGNFTGLATAVEPVMPCDLLPSGQPAPLCQIRPASSISQ